MSDNSPIQTICNGAVICSSDMTIQYVDTYIERIVSGIVDIEDIKSREVQIEKGIVMDIMRRYHSFTGGKKNYSPDKIKEFINKFAHNYTNYKSLTGGQVYKNKSFPDKVKYNTTIRNILQQVLNDYNPSTGGKRRTHRHKKSKRTRRHKKK